MRLLAPLAIAITLAGCTQPLEEKAYVVQVQGDAVPVIGTVTVTRGDGRVTSTNVEGVVPMTWNFSAWGVMACIGKQDFDGAIQVQILDGANLVSSERTTARLGTVCASTPIQ